MSTDTELQYHRISPSELQQYRKCRRLWHFTDQLRLEPIKAQQPLDTGTAGHAAMECYYAPEYWEAIPRRLRALQAVAVFQQTMGAQRDRAAMAGIVLDDEQLEAWTKDFENVTGALKHYFEWAGANDNFTPLHGEYKINTPLMWRTKEPHVAWGLVLCPCHGLPIHLTGKIDMIKVMPDGSLRAVDWKFVGSHKENTTYLTLDEQMGCYLLGFQKQEQKIIDGADYMEILKDYPKPPPQLKPTKKEPVKFSQDKTNPTDYTNFAKTLIAHGMPHTPYEEYLDYLRLNRGPEFWFRKTEVDRSQTELQLLQERIVEQVQEMLSEPAIYPNPSPFLCGYCAFNGPCQQMNQGEDYLHTLKDNYRPKKSNRDEEMNK